MQSTQPTWNDQRMDEFAERTEENFREVRSEIQAVRTELRGEIRGAETGLRSEMNERFSGLGRRFDIMLGAMATGFVGLIVSHFLG